MSHDRAGNFRAKHPAHTTVDNAIMTQVAEKMVNGVMSCKTAHEIAQALGVAPSLVGVAIDIRNCRIKGCRLGLFGYGKVKTIALEGPQAPSNLKAAIENAVTHNRLSCLSAWQIARKQGISRLEMGRACEQLEIKITDCQLGAF